MNKKEQVLEAVTQFPGMKSSQLIELCPDMHDSTVYANLVALVREGRVVKRLKTGACRGIFYHATDGYAQPKAPSPILAIGSDELIELRKWKAAAILRYPDLAVAEIVLRARKIVAELAKSDKAMFADIMAGRKDNSLAIKATVSALETVVS